MKKGILGAGNWIVDLVKMVDRFPKEGELCNIRSIEQGGGGVCNLLFDIAAMKCDIPLFAAGMIGNDNNGKWLLEEIKKRGINSDGMKINDQVGTSYTDVISANAKRTFFHYRGANAYLDYQHLCDFPKDIKIFYVAYLLLLDKLDGVDDEYGTPAARLLKEVQENGIMTVVDFVSEAKEKFLRVTQAALPYIDVLVINEIEAGNTFDLEIRREDNSLNLDNLELALKKFIGAGVKKYAIVHMPEGSIAIDNELNITYEASCACAKSDIVGTNGAGDAFCAGVVYSLHENLSVNEMLRIGAASSFFNLKSATASNGAVPIEQILNQAKNGEYLPLLAKGHI